MNELVQVKIYTTKTVLIETGTEQKPKKNRIDMNFFI